MKSTFEIIEKADKSGKAIPSFNVPYLPMIEPIISAVADEESFALVAVARLEWMKFESKSLVAVSEEFSKWYRPEYVRLHLDHVPVIDEDNENVEFLPVIQEAIDLGYQSVMIDASRLDLEENIQATRQVVDMAHRANVPCEAELGAVLGHEAVSLPPYEKLFKSGKGFTDVKEATRFVAETGCDWLSVAIGNIHGAIAEASRDESKVEARLNIGHLAELREATDIPLVLHGGSGVKKEYVREAIQNGISKINIGTENRQTYESTLRESGDVTVAQDAVYERTRWLIGDYLGLAGTAAILTK